MILSSSSTRVFMDARNFSSKSFISPAIGAFISLSVGDISRKYTTPDVSFKGNYAVTPKSCVFSQRVNVGLPVNWGSDFLLQFVDFRLSFLFAKGKGFLIKLNCLSQRFPLFSGFQLGAISSLLYRCSARIVCVGFAHLRLNHELLDARLDEGKFLLLCKYFSFLVFEHGLLKAYRLDKVFIFTTEFFNLLLKYCNLLGLRLQVFAQPADGCPKRCSAAGLLFQIFFKRVDLLFCFCNVILEIAHARGVVVEGSALHDIHFQHLPAGIDGVEKDAYFLQRLRHPLAVLQLDFQRVDTRLKSFFILCPAADSQHAGNRYEKH